ncbi:MAG TPA: FAD-dependent oxidoreductase [Myxococcaceae bacterium]|nr:FAD-dependent oxidoreductase [Myxococcaceae bacterium]
MKRLVLVGSGHAHLFVLEGLARARWTMVETVWIVLESRQVYSGMISGWLAGDYPLEALTFDLALIARAARVRLVTGGAVRIDAAGRRVLLADGTEVTYDVLSVDVGSLPAKDDLPGVAMHAVPLKPIQRALALHDVRGPVLVAGGGYAGVELALCLRARTRARTCLVSKTRSVPSGASHPLAHKALRALQVHGVEVLLDESVIRLEPGRAHLRAGGSVSFETAVWAGGARAPALLERSGLALDAHGYLLVNECLQSPSHPEVFGAGDCTGRAGDVQVPKSGVHAVDQGPILWRNLQVALAARAVSLSYRPRRAATYLINAGDRTGMGEWRGIAVHNRAVWHLKDQIDRRFMRRFQALRP